MAEDAIKNGPVRAYASQPVIGLEIHAQLNTASKMFCGCSARYASADPNTHVCAVCVGAPGSLPVTNGKALELGLRTALALNCTIAGESRFDRKNYQYPDIPKGYQISQYDRPIGTCGWLEYVLDGETRRCGITRLHLEEDTGKSVHAQDLGARTSLVDYNRAGVPLMEIVTEPELESPQAAQALFRTLRQVLMYLGVCDGKLQEGSMRADVNVSITRPDGTWGTKIEVKNLNSFRSVYQSIEFEIERQRDVLSQGIPLVQETRGWSEKLEKTVSQRTKEYAHDYRYFPEPDLPPMVVTRNYLSELAHGLPELPLARLSRFQREYDLPLSKAELLTSETGLAKFFEDAAKSARRVEATDIANWVAGDVLAHLNDLNGSSADLPFDGSQLGALLILLGAGKVSRTAAKQILQEMLSTGETADDVVRRLNLGRMDEDALVLLVDHVMTNSEQLVQTYLGGKTKALEAIVGRVMGESKGKADAAAARTLVEDRLRARS